MTTQLSQNISMKEAVKLSGKSEATIRRLISQKEIRASKDLDGRYIIEEESLRHYLVTKASTRSTLPTQPRHGASLRPRDGHFNEAVPNFHDAIEEGVVPILKEVISQLRDDLERERQRASAIEARLFAAEAEKTQHLAEMRAMLSKDSQVKEGVISRWIRR